MPVTCDLAWVFGVGTTVVHCSASDLDDTPSTVSTTLTVNVTDTDLSIKTVPPIVVNASVPSGAPVPFAKPAATDEDDPVAVSCDHSSRATYPIGVTTVTCHASDS